jgi:hypothetical protein
MQQRQSGAAELLIFRTLLCQNTALPEQLLCQEHSAGETINMAKLRRSALPCPR